MTYIFNTLINDHKAIIASGYLHVMNTNFITHKTLFSLHLITIYYHVNFH